jgi:hypothetical protein
MVNSRDIPGARDVTCASTRSVLGDKVKDVSAVMRWLAHKVPATVFNSITTQPGPYSSMSPQVPESDTVPALRASTGRMMRSVRASSVARMAGRMLMMSFMWEKVRKEGGEVSPQRREGH